ncbi:unnamed protein product [Phytophthora fragariaefolia]|uniref:Unnamed protein product n=1 Tax=Phytophthora fragariaefolia TaxID=1490495 RepID=A0A9W6WQD3_9STRA|nr:unnamed protein product [Phytophthora fragariaefolia]
MPFAALSSGVDGPASFRQRRLSSPRSPLLQKLNDDRNVRHPRRIKDRREEAVTRQNEQRVRSELQNQQQQCRERFLGRWHHVRQLYAVVSEAMTARSEAMTTRPKLSPSAVGTTPTSTLAKPTDPSTPAPLHNLTAMAWLVDVAREFRQGLASHQVTMAQMEVAIGSALHLKGPSARSALPIAQIESSLRHVFQAFQHHPDSCTIDYREILSALFVLDRWREGEKKMVARWFHEFAFPLAENSTAIGDMKMAVRGPDLQRMLLTACGDETEEAKMQPFVKELLAVMAQRGRSYIAERTFWDYSVLRSCLETWLSFKRRQDEAAAADIRGRLLQQDLLLFQQIETERSLMEVEDKLSAVVDARIRQTDEMGPKRSFFTATERVHANRKMQKQKEERIQYKTSHERAAESEAKQAWAAIAEQVAAEVRTATLTWLKTTDAKDQLNGEATRIFETDAKWIRNELDRDPENAPFRILPRGCRWQVFLEAPHGTVTRRQTKAFYLNTMTYEKYWCDEVVIEECEGIAREVIVQWRIDDALARLNEKEAEWALHRRQNIAATRIQMLYRCRQARAVCRRIIRNTFVKRIDPSSGQIVYFNLAQPQEIRRRPPKLIGSDESLIPVESSTWVYRQDSNGSGYYERIDTGERLAGPPDHYILCTRCSVHFVTRRKLSSGARYCIGCYSSFRYAARRETTNVEDDSGWTKMPVQPANCMVCRNAAAHFVCADCKYDATCTRCFNAVHGRLAKNKTHSPSISLINRTSE